MSKQALVDWCAKHFEFNVAELAIFPLVSPLVDGVSKLLLQGPDTPAREVLLQRQLEHDAKYETVDCPYFKLGYWGHGISSYRFVYSLSTIVLLASSTMRST